MTTPKAAIVEQLKTVKAALGEQVALRDRIVAEMDPIRSGRMTNPTNEMARVQDTFGPELDRVMSTARAAAAEALRIRDAAMLDPGTAAGSAQEQLLVEMRAERAWNRVQRTLDALDAMTAADRAASLVEDATDPAIRRLLLEELPTYLEARLVSDEATTRNAGKYLATALSEIVDAVGRADPNLGELQTLARHAGEIVASEIAYNDGLLRGHMGENSNRAFGEIGQRTRGPGSPGDVMLWPGDAPATEMADA